jgi:predicted HTH transcriptional regulator
MPQADLKERFLALSGEDLQRFVSDQQEENLHLDFKNLSDGDIKSGDDKHNFAKALSGFANSDGGIVVWGVDARKDEVGVDCAQQLSPIANVAALLPRLNSLTSDLVSPSVEGVEHRVLLTQPDGRGCAATIIPRSDSGPHMAKAGLDRYYKRSGDSFLKMEHFEVADMFGRRPNPDSLHGHRRHAPRLSRERSGTLTPHPVARCAVTGS